MKWPLQYDVPDGIELTPTMIDGPLPIDAMTVHTVPAIAVAMTAIGRPVVLV